MRRIHGFQGELIDRIEALKPQLVILGTGGHAKVVIEMLEQVGEVRIAGCTGVLPAQTEILGYPILGDDSTLAALLKSGIDHAFIAIGDNALRLKLLKLTRSLGFKLVNAVSPHAVVSPRAIIGEGVAIMSGAVINVDAKIGDCAIVNTGATIDHDCVLGAGCHIGPGVNLAGCVTLREGAFLGVGCCVIPHVSIGAWTVVGAGGVVISDLPEKVLAVGVPARVKM